MNLHLRRIAAMTAALTLLVACSGSPSPSPSPSASGVAPSAVPGSAPPAPTPGTSAEPTAGPPGDTTDRWAGAGTMAWARRAPTALLLGDGRVLVLGDEGGKYEAVPERSRFAELFDPGSGAWRETSYLGKARGEFGAVTLTDGRAMVVGGVNDRWVSYSSAYAFDPATEAWTKLEGMAAGRTSPAVAVLGDGRVLVAGGAYYTGVREGVGTGVASLAAVRVPLADAWPGPEGHALASAELFDPQTGEWSGTGAMRFARATPTAVTLADGRVLVVGAGAGWTDQIDDRAETTPEIYDPGTGSFSIAERLPAVDQDLLARIDVPERVRADLAAASDRGGRGGRLIALPDGDALLLGTRWDGGEQFLRSFRFAAATGHWTEVGEPFVEWCDGPEDPETGDCELASAGVLHPDGIVVPLADGRVLAAGGPDAAWMGTRDAELLDPATGTWSLLERMPGARITAAAVLTADGSVLIVGGYSDGGDGYPIPLADAFLFVPAS